MPRTELTECWQREARELGISHPQVSQARSVEPEANHRELLSEAIEHASERDVSFRHEALERFALESHMGRFDLEKFGAEVTRAKGIFDLIPCDEGRYTTSQAIKTEERILASLARGKDRCLPISSEIPREVRDNLLGLSLGQQNALELSLSSRDQFLAWQGVAGAGKTFAMNELRKVSAINGYQVRGFAPSAEAAKVLSEEAGIVGVFGCRLAKVLKNSCRVLMKYFQAVSPNQRYRDFLLQPGSRNLSLSKMVSATRGSHHWHSFTGGMALTAMRPNRKFFCA